MKITSELLHALAEVESGHNPDAVGDNGNSVGILQISVVTLKDINSKYGFEFEPDDRLNPELSFIMAALWFAWWEEFYERGQRFKESFSENRNTKADNEILARMWNGGPRGWMKTCTLSYWEKVEKELASGKWRR